MTPTGAIDEIAVEKGRTPVLEDPHEPGACEVTGPSPKPVQSGPDHTYAGVVEDDASDTTVPRYLTLTTTLPLARPVST